jgi:hypothetical protein
MITLESLYGKWIIAKIPKKEENNIKWFKCKWQKKIKTISFFCMIKEYTIHENAKFANIHALIFICNSFVIHL